MRQLIARFALERDASGAIYGTIITASTIAAVSEGVHQLGQVVVTVAGTLALYAVAHTYSSVLGAPEGRTPSWGAFGHELATEAPMLSACAIPLAVMLIAYLLGTGLDRAVDVALATAVAMLFIWGLVAARKVHADMTLQFVSAAAFGLVGMGLVALRIATGQ